MKKRLFFILTLFFNYFCNYGQSINYSDLISYNSQDFIFKIVGRIGNTIHIWKIPTSILGEVTKKSLISLFIFSDQMRLIVEKDFPVKNVTFSFIDLAFQIKSDDYYVNINYFNGDQFVKRQLLKINEEGGFTDCSLQFKRAGYDDSANFNSRQYAINSSNSTIIRNNKFLIGANTTQIEATLSETPSPKNDSTPENKIIIYKKYLSDQHPGAEVQYSSSIFNFDHPRIVLDNDNSVWACCSSAITKNDKDSSSGYSFFLVKLDSNLKEVHDSMKFLKRSNAGIFKKDIYSLQNIFLIEHNLFLISFGNRSYFQTIIPSFKSRYDVNQFYTAHQVEKYEISSLHIIQLDKSMSILTDTIIDVNSAYSQLHLENSFCYTSGKDIDLLCLQQFPHKLNGIRHIVIGKNFIKGTDFQVNPRYNYILPNTKMIDEITFLIPYTHNGKIGFMKCSNID